MTDNAPENPAPSTPQPAAVAAPASAPAPAPAPPHRLFTPRLVGAASLLGAPLAGGILMAVNAYRLRQLTSALLAFGMGVLFTISLLGLAPYFPGLRGLALLAGGAVMMVWVANTLQGDLVAAHRRVGGLESRPWVAALVGLLVGAALFLTLHTLARHQQQKLQQQQQQQQQQGQPTTQPGQVRMNAVQVTNNQHLLVAEHVPQSETDTVARALRQAGFFDESGQTRQAILLKDAGRTAVVFPAEPGKTDEASLKRNLAGIAEGLARAGLARPFTIRLAHPSGPNGQMQFWAEVTVNASTSQPTTQP